MLRDGPARLRALMRAGDLIWGPGVYDGISARIAAALPFPMLYMTGAGTAASRIGQPDLGLATLSEMVENARVIAGVSNVPVLCDADTGFGGPVNVARAVHLYESAGAAGVHIEDQTFPKRCGHLEGKTVVERAEFVQRIRAAVNERSDPDFVIVARTDARQPNGLGDALDRIRAAFDAGADVGFLEGPQTLDEVETVARDAPGPMLLNLVTNGATPTLRRERVRELGYRFAIWPTTTAIAAAQAIRRALETLLETGTDEAVVGDWAPRELFDVVGLEEAIAVDRRSGSSALVNP